MRKLALLSILALFIINVSYSQVGVGTTTPDASAVLDVSSDASVGGMLIPRLDNSERDGITEPAHSLLIYNDEESVFQYNAGTTLAPDWQNLVLKDNIQLYSGTAGVIQSNNEDNTGTATLLINPDGGNVGVNVDDEANVNEALVVNGAIKIGDGSYTGITDGGTSPVPDGGAGTIVFSSAHFYVWTGTQWNQID